MADQTLIEHTTFALLGPIIHTATRVMPCHGVIFQVGERVILLDTGLGTREIREPNRLLGDEVLWRLAPVIDPRLTVSSRKRLCLLCSPPRGVTCHPRQALNHCPSIQNDD